jgi:hypothetical protein
VSEDTMSIPRVRTHSRCRSSVLWADALLTFTLFKVISLTDLALCFHRASSHGLSQSDRKAVRKPK